MKRILLLGSQHGNEVLGINLFKHILSVDPELGNNIDYICGNPNAFLVNKRFTESDLNRSYGAQNIKTYEEKRAHEILLYIKEHKFDYVIDLHTSTSDIGKALILPSLSENIRKIINRSNIYNIIVMPPHIVSQSLIGNVPNSISVEYNENLATKHSSLVELYAFVKMLSVKTACQPKKRNVFHVDRLIKTEELKNERVTNYTKTSSGYYPLLYGEKNYTTYSGFAASTKTELLI